MGERITGHHAISEFFHAGKKWPKDGIRKWNYYNKIVNVSIKEKIFHHWAFMMKTSWEKDESRGGRVRKKKKKGGK